MQTRLPARLPAPKLLSLAHVIGLEQSGAGRARKEERGLVAAGHELGAGAPVLARATARAELEGGWECTQERVFRGRFGSVDWVRINEEQGYL